MTCISLSLSDTQQAWLIKILIDYLLQLVSSVDPAILKLTKTDNEIYDHFRSEFPDLKIDKIDTDEMKSAEGKEVSIIYIG